MSGLCHHQGRVIRTELEVDVSPWQAWFSWGDKTQRSNWLLHREEGELAVGNRIRWFLARNTRPLDFMVRSLEDERSVVFELQPSGQLLEIGVEGTAGNSRISITHSGFPDGPEGDWAYNQSIAAWQFRANVLKLYLESYFGRCKETIGLRHIVRVPITEARKCIVDPAGLGGWLTLEGRLAPLRVSSIKLWDGTSATSRTLVSASDILMFTWEEGKGFVLFTCQPKSGGVSAIGTKICSWMQDPSRLATFAETVRVGLSNRIGSFLTEVANEEVRQI